VHVAFVLRREIVDLKMSEMGLGCVKT